VHPELDERLELALVSKHVAGNDVQHGTGKGAGADHGHLRSMPGNNHEPNTSNGAGECARTDKHVGGTSAWQDPRQLPLCTAPTPGQRTLRLLSVSASVSWLYTNHGAAAATALRSTTPPVDEVGMALMMTYMGLSRGLPRACCDLWECMDCAGGARHLMRTGAQARRRTDLTTDLWRHAQAHATHRSR